MQQKDANEWKHKEVDRKTTLLEDIPSNIYFCSISHMTHSLYDSTDNYDSTHPNLEHDSHSTHTLSVILYPHYPIVHMMSHVILLFLKCSGTFFRVCNISLMAALHDTHRSQQCENDLVIAP